MTTTFDKSTFINLSPTQRAARVLLGAAMIGAAVIAPVDALGAWALLPLLAIIPITTGVTGFCPAYFKAAQRSVSGADAELSMPAQIELGVIGTVLIGTLYVVPVETLGGFTVIALLGLVPLLVALMGTDPIVAFLDRVRGADSKGYIPVSDAPVRRADVQELPAAARGTATGTGSTDGTKVRAA